MKPFRFTLEPLRVIRERQEREAMERYGQALAEVGKCKNAHAEVEREIVWLREESKRVLLQGFSSAEIIQHQLYGEHLEQKRKKAIEAIKNSEDQAQKTMQAMLLARQERDIVDKFRDKQRAIYDRALTVEEQKLLDELAARRLDSALSWKAQ